MVGPLAGVGRHARRAEALSSDSVNMTAVTAGQTCNLDEPLLVVQAIRVISLNGAAHCTAQQTHGTRRADYPPVQPGRIGPRVGRRRAA